MSILPPLSGTSISVNILSGLSLLLLHNPSFHPIVLYLLSYLTGYHLSIFPSLPVVPILLSLLLPNSSPLETPPLLLHLSLSTIPLLLTTLVYPPPLSRIAIFYAVFLTSLFSLILLLNAPTYPISPTIPPLPIHIPIPPLNLRHAAAIFNLRQDLVTLLHRIPFIPSPRLVYQSCNSSVFVLLGALARSYSPNLFTLSHFRSAVSLTTFGWVITEIRVSPIQDGLPSGLTFSASAIVILVTHGLTILLSTHLRSLLFPLAVLGGNFLTALVIVEVRFVERVLDGITTGGVSALNIIKGVCEVFGAGNAMIANVLYATFKMTILSLMMMSLEGLLPLAMFNVGRRKFEAAGGRRLGSHLD